jgi:hypothetical protein
VLVSQADQCESRATPRIGKKGPNVGASPAVSGRLDMSGHGGAVRWTSRARRVGTVRTAPT